MAKIRLQKKKSKFAQVSRKLLSNPKISLRAKGLGSWLELHQDGFELNFEFILQNMKEGRDAIRETIKELKEQGFLLTLQIRDKNGKFQTVWHFDSDGDIDIEPTTENPPTVEPPTVNPTQIIKVNNTIKNKRKNTNNTLSPKSSLKQKKEEERSFDKSLFLKFIEDTRKVYKGNGDRNWFPTLFDYQDKQIGVNSNGHLYAKGTGETLLPSEAQNLWEYIFKHKEQIVSIEHQIENHRQKIIQELRNKTLSQGDQAS